MSTSMKLLFAGLAALVLGACAGQPAQVADKSATTAKKDCVRETGTRIEVPEGKCANVPGGRVYTQEDLERTGAQSLAEALRRIRR